MDIAIKDIFHYLLITIRISSFIMVAPFWSTTTISARVKIALCCFISFIIGFGVKPVEIFPQNIYDTVFLIFKQIFFGLILGFISKLFLDGIRTGAAVMDIQMGYGFGKVLDPNLGAQSSIIELFYSLFTMIILLTTGAHVLILKAIMKSFQLIPLDGKMEITSSLANYVISMTGELFLITIQIAGPIIGILFLIEMCMGVIAKMVPQINLFTFDFPIKLAVGLICVILSLPFYPEVVNRLVNNMLEHFVLITKAF